MLLERVRIAPASFAFTALLGLLAALPALSIDISAPTLVLLPRELGTTTTVAGLTLSLFMAGFGAGQLAGGRASDRYGRRPVLLTGLVCYVAAGFACAVAASGAALVAARAAQGAGAGACSVIAFAMVQDLFKGDAARSKRSYVTVVFALVPMLAPALGAVLVQFVSWRFIYVFLAAAGLLLLAVVSSGLAESRRGRGPAGFAVQATRPWLAPRFVRLVLINGLSYGSIFAYIAASPVVVMGQMGRSSAVFATLFASTALALTAGAWTSGRLAQRGVSAASLLGPGLCLGSIAALAVAAASAAGATSGAVFLPLLMALLFSRGVVAPNLQQLAVEGCDEAAGAASALIGVSQLLSGALASAVAAWLLPTFELRGVAALMSVLSVAAFAAWSVAGKTELARRPS